MDGRVILALGGFIVIIILGALYMQEYDFEGARVKAVAMEEQLSGDRHELESAKLKIGPSDQHSAQLLDSLQLIVNRDQLLKDIVELRRKRDSALEELLGTVKAVRNRDIGVTMPEFVTKSGTKYVNVRITSVTGAGLGIVHEQGASRVVDAELVEPYKSRYRVDLDAKVQLALEESKPKPEKPDPSTMPAVISPPMEVASPSNNGPDKATLDKISALQSQSTYYHQQVDNLRQQQSYYLDKARTLTSRSASSSGSGTIYTSNGSYYTTTGRIHSDPAQASRAEEQAKEYDKQISAFAAQAAQVDAQIEALRRR